MAAHSRSAVRKTVNIAPRRASPPRAAEVDAAINALYDAAGDPGLLPGAVEKITACLRSHRAFLLVRPSNQIAAAPIFGQPCNFAPEVLATLADYWEGDPLVSGRRQDQSAVGPGRGRRAARRDGRVSP